MYLGHKFVTENNDVAGDRIGTCHALKSPASHVAVGQRCLKQLVRRCSLVGLDQSDPQLLSVIYTRPRHVIIMCTERLRAIRETVPPNCTHALLLVHNIARVFIMQLIVLFVFLKRSMVSQSKININIFHFVNIGYNHYYYIYIYILSLI